MKKTIFYITLIAIFCYLLSFLYGNLYDFYYVTKYLVNYRPSDIMFSIIFIYLFINYFISTFYDYILNRNHIIVRYGYQKYKKMIFNKIMLSVIGFILFNIAFDYIFDMKVMFLPLIFNTVIIVATLLFFPRKREYDMELVIAISTVFIIRLLISMIFLV